MDLSEFKKHYIMNDTCRFGDFVCSRRAELGYSVRTFASMVGLSAMYISDIERNARPAPLRYLGVFAEVLKVSESEKEDFIDMAKLSHQDWPEIMDYITKNPHAREVLSLAQKNNIPDSFFEKLALRITKYVSPSDSIEEENETI